MEPFEVEREDKEREQDPKKPREGESYADYMHRLRREQEAEKESTDYGKEEYWASLSDYGRGRSGDPNYGEIPEEYSMNGMSKAAFACGILSLLSLMFGFSLFFGALGVLFACLSKKGKFGRQARIALWMSAAGIFAFVISLAVSLHMLVANGIWVRMVDRVRQMDLSDPNAAAVLEQELLDELLGAYGVERTDGQGAPRGSGR